MPLDDRRLAMLKEMGVPFWQPLAREFPRLSRTTKVFSFWNWSLTKMAAPLHASVILN
jgi:hypothetical protein